MESGALMIRSPGRLFGGGKDLLYLLISLYLVCVLHCFIPLVFELGRFLCLNMIFW